MFQLDVKSRKSIYEQVVDNLKELIVSSVLKEGEKLPSVRELSGQLTINPNTVQKAYRELERQGYVYTTSGLGTFVADRAEKQLDMTKLNTVLSQLRADIRELHYLGMSKEEALNRIKELIEERRDWK